MPGPTIVNKQKGQPLNKKKAKSNNVPNSKVSVTVDSLIVNVFFDGTGNNMYNTKARLDNEHTRLAGQVSYDNYYSNIALLYMACTETPKVKKIYIMGSGTFKYKKDSLFGLGLSTGSSGVKARVTEAFQQINLLKEKFKIKRITFNVFGFSRGAFNARYFCAMAKISEKITENKTGTKALDSGRYKLDMPPDKLTINLVGIYDTVSSEGLSHYNDVKPFDLNIGKKQGIAKIIHLTAQNEYRNHFPLTRVNTAASEGIAFECSFPGAHSDLGGSYNVKHKESTPGDKWYISILEKEESYFNRKEGEIHWSWFEKMGYYKSASPLVAKEGANGDFELVKAKHFKVFKSYYQLYSLRVFNANSYQFIPLNIMKKLTEKFAKLTFTAGGGKVILEKDIASIAQYPILTKFAKYAYDYVNKNCTNSGLAFAVRAANILSKTEEQEMYHKYIHNSLNPATIPNGGDSRNKGPFNPQRIIINDNS